MTLNRQITTNDALLSLRVSALHVLVPSSICMICQALGAFHFNQSLVNEAM